MHEENRLRQFYTHFRHTHHHHVRAGHCVIPGDSWDSTVLYYSDYGPEWIKKLSIHKLFFIKYMILYVSNYINILLEAVFKTKLF